MDSSSGQTYGRQMGQPQGQTTVYQTTAVQQGPPKQEAEKKEGQEIHPPHHPIPSPFILRVLEARGLKSTDMSGLADPYIYIKFKKGLLTSGKLQSRVVERNLNPVWNEEFVLHPHHPDTDVIQIFVYDKDRLGRDKFLGKILLPAAQYWKRGIIDEWIPLQGKRKTNLVVSGELHIVVYYDEVEKGGTSYGSYGLSSAAASGYGASSTSSSSAALPSQTPSALSSSYVMAPSSTATRQYFYPSSQYTSTPASSYFSTSGSSFVPPVYGYPTDSRSMQAPSYGSMSSQTRSGSIGEGLYPPPVRTMEMPSLEQLQQQSQQGQQMQQPQQTMQYQQSSQSQLQQPQLLMSNQPPLSFVSMTPSTYPLSMPSSSYMSSGYTPLSSTSSYQYAPSSSGLSSGSSGAYPPPMATHHD